MTEIDLDLSGFAELRTDLEILEEQGESNAVYKVGTDRDYGVILEFGRGGFRVDDDTAIPIETESGEIIFRQSVSGHPPYPWFRPAVREFKANPINFIVNTTDFDSLADFKTVDELVTAVAIGLQTQMEKNVSANTSTDRSPGTHPEHPQRDTGTLVNSIQAVRIA